VAPGTAVALRTEHALDRRHAPAVDRERELGLEAQDDAILPAAQELGLQAQDELTFAPGFVHEGPGTASVEMTGLGDPPRRSPPERDRRKTRVPSSVSSVTSP